MITETDLIPIINILSGFAFMYLSHMSHITTATQQYSYAAKNDYNNM